LPLLLSRRNSYVVLAAVIVVGLAVGLFTVPNLLKQQRAAPSPLSANFIIDPYPPDAGQRVSFVGGASGGTLPYSYSWSFGDGSSGTGSTTTHAYSSAGTFTAVLTISDNGSPKQSATSRQTVTVVASPSPPSSPSEVKILYSSSYNDTLEPSGVQPANSGDTFLVVHFTVENKGYANFSANPFSDMYIVVGLNSYNVSAAYLFLRYPFPPTNLTNGQTASGDVAFEVPKTSSIFTADWRLMAGEQVQFDWVPI